MEVMIVFIQARSNSYRLQNKVMEDICGKPMLEWVIGSCRTFLPYMVLIPNNDPIKKWLIKNNHPFFEGDEDNVLKRHYDAAIALKRDVGEIYYIMRITSDCPFIDTSNILLFKMLMVDAIRNDRKIDFISNAYSAPDGQEIEIMSFKILEWAYKNATTEFDKSHVTTYIKNNIRNDLFSYGIQQSSYNKKWFPKMSVDTKEDLEWARQHMQFLSDNKRIYEKNITK